MRVVHGDGGAFRHTRGGRKGRGGLGGVKSVVACISGARVLLLMAGTLP